MLITPEMIVNEWGACVDYPMERVREMIGDGMTPLQVAGLESVPVEDRLWVLLHEAVIPARELRLLGCDFAERALSREREAGREPDPRSWNAVEVSRRFADGLATREELIAARAAAWDAARDAAWDAARDAAWDAARDAAWDAARDAAWDAAESATWGVEKQWQLDRVVAVAHRVGSFGTAWQQHQD